MFKRTVIALAVAAACAAPAAAQESELSKIRNEIKQMRDAYERRIEELEKRLSAAETKAGKAESAASTAAAAAGKAESAAATATAAAGKAESTAGRAEIAASKAEQTAGRAESTATAARSGENAFNPAISLIMQGTYANTSQNPNTYQLTGFVPTNGEVGPPTRSFSLGETELMISANIDHYFRGHAMFAVAPEGGINVEEAYVQTLALPRGFGLKGGRFFSGVGYLNEQHQHAWDFQDAPLVYKAVFGPQLKQDGLQLKWIAPTDLLFEVGAEASAGGQFPGGTQNRNGVGGGALFANFGGDIGASTAWRVGMSYLRTKSSERSYDDIDAAGGATTNTFTGTARVAGINGVLKWAPNGNATYNNFKLQGEYFRLKQDGTLKYDDTAGNNVFGTVTGGFQSSQPGWYAQGVWQFMPRWRVGYRYDALSRGTLNNGIVQNNLGPSAADFPVLANHSPRRNTAMLDWSPSEYSRIRLQFAQDKSRIGLTDNQVFVQYIYSLGAHGAHKF